LEKRLVVLARAKNSAVNPEGARAGCGEKAVRLILVLHATEDLELEGGEARQVTERAWDRRRQDCAQVRAVAMNDEGMTTESGGRRERAWTRRRGGLAWCGR
jgi:hypothetical protein